jgi:sterol desaturase/sphingolipid hydroxylase (fatty acid hydroxylase superfamily)
MLFTLIEKFGILSGWALSAFFIFVRYAAFAGLAFLVFYLLWHKHFQHARIQLRFPKAKKIRFEIVHSLLTAGVFAAMGVLIYFVQQAGYTMIYREVAQLGWAYLLFSFFVLTIIHDTYFYWMHRLMHHPRLFKILHRVHHVSNNPTPWAALSFHPLEAIVEIAIIPLTVLIMPFHPLALFAFSFWSLGFNVLGHLGFELFPKGFVKHPFWKWFNTSTHHNLHHSRSNCNYGLYYNFWDRMMGTNAPDYEQTFAEVKSRSGVSKQSITA